jgi:hypothetical protein
VTARTAAGARRLAGVAGEPVLSRGTWRTSIWAHFLGVGHHRAGRTTCAISNPASNPELLDELAKTFTDYKFDFKKLVRDICLSRTYQLATRAELDQRADTRNFAKAHDRRIRAEVLLDCISQVTEAKEKFRGLPLGARAVQIADGRRATTSSAPSAAPARDGLLVRSERWSRTSRRRFTCSTARRRDRRSSRRRREATARREKKTPEQVIEELYLRTSRASRARRRCRHHRAAEGREGPGPGAERPVLGAAEQQEFMFAH